MSHPTNIVLHDRIKELSHTQGQGPFVLDGKLNGFSPFGDFYQYGDVVFYAATDGTRYEVGSGEYRQNGSDNELTRFPFKSTALDAGPYYINEKSSTGGTAGKEGYFHPLFLTKSAALAVAGATTVHAHTFSGFPGITFYMPNNHQGHAEPAFHSYTSGVNYNASGLPYNFPDGGIKEVYVTYPGKNSVFTAFGVSGFKEPIESGIAFWGSNQTLDYDGEIVWSSQNSMLGISNSAPRYAIDVAGTKGYAHVKASGFIGGGSGILFSGGQALPQDGTKTASGGTQLEPFYRSTLDNSTGTDAVFYLKGLVDQTLSFQKQPKGTFLAGPPSGCAPASCSPDYPTFRLLTSGDMPDLSALYVVQDKEIGVNTSTIAAGNVALYKESGVITYDTNDALFVSKANNRVGVNTASPRVTLDVFGDMAVSGNLDVRGELTYIDSSTVTIFDKQLEVASMSGTAIFNAAGVDDGGLVIKSTQGDKKWTWRDSTDAWTTDQKLNASGIIFTGDSSIISGAYQAGSGLTLRSVNGGDIFDVGNVFNVKGAKNNGGAISAVVHQSETLVASGYKGVDVYWSSNVDEGDRPSGIVGAQLDALLFDATPISGWVDGKLASLAGGYGHWKLTVESGPGSGVQTNEVSTTEAIKVSGVSGVTAHYRSESNHLVLSSHELSGVMDTKISAAVNYNYWTLKVPNDSGVWTDNVTSTDTVSVSGASGINVHLHAGDERIMIDAGALSGQLVHEISAAVNYNYWNLTVESGPGSGVQTENISSTDPVKVSGVGGVDVHYRSESNHVVISASGLSGVMRADLDTVSLGAVTAGSGLTKTGSVFHMDIDDAGQLRELGFWKEPITSGEQIRIGQIGTVGYVGSGIAMAYGAASGLHNGSGSAFIGPRAGAMAWDIQYANVIGYNAGSGAVNNGLSNILGKNAGVGASGSYQSNMIGRSAGRRTWDSPNGNFIGLFAGRDSSGVMTSDMIGAAAGAQTSGSSYLVGFGTEAASGMSESNLAVAVGKQAYARAHNITGGVAVGFRAGSGVMNASGSVMIGACAAGTSRDWIEAVVVGPYAGYRASGQQARTIAIGAEAGTQALYSTESIFMGRWAGGWSSGVNSDGLDGTTANHNIGIGSKALHYATGCKNVIMIGEQAGHKLNHQGVEGFGGATPGLVENVIGIGKSAASNGIDLEDVVGVGRWAASNASGCTRMVSLGVGAGSGARNCTDVQFMGWYAGLHASGNNDGLNIGQFAGRNASGCARTINIGERAGAYCYSADDSIHIGYWAGRYRHGSESTIITPGPLGNVTPTSWADNTQDGILHLHDLIHGVNYSDTNRVLSVGAQPASVGDMNYTTLGVRPPSANHIGIKTYQIASQQADQIESSTNSTGFANTIVNRYGWLEVPTALQWVPGPPGNTLNGALYTDASSTNNEYHINSREGTIALYVKDSVVQLAVYGNSQWNFTTMSDTPTP